MSEPAAEPKVEDARAKYDNASEWSKWSGDVAIIFAIEPKPIDEVISESNRRFNYGSNLTRQCLSWLDQRGLAKPSVRKGVTYWGRPVDVQGLVNAAASVVEVVAHPVEQMGGEKAAKLMREVAATARAVPAAVEGVKKEAKPAIDAFKRLGAAAKEAGIFRLREPIEVQQPKRQEAPKPQPKPQPKSHLDGVK